MPRISRAIAVGYPHHITQRGNYRQTVFADPGDYAFYLEKLAKYAAQYGLDIWAYCLMPNHIHLVAVPGDAASLARTLNTVHMLYAQHHNRKRESKGHLWQGRFFSCMLDERHLYAAVRYVELNPVRGGLVGAAEYYGWSSAKNRVLGNPDPILRGQCFLTETVTDWRRFLGQEQDAEAQARVIKATGSGQPCGTTDFVEKMEKVIGRRFTPHRAGRPGAVPKRRENVTTGEEIEPDAAGGPGRTAETGDPILS